MDMERLLSALLVCAALFIAVKGADSQTGHGQTLRRHLKEYINSWAVEVRGGRIHADEVARRNGFENHGEVNATYYPSIYSHVAYLCRSPDFPTFTTFGWLDQRK